jgi:hypothetical protein
VKKIVLLFLSVVVIASCYFQPETPAQISKKLTVEDIERYTLDRHDELALLHLVLSHDVSSQELERKVNMFLASDASRRVGSADSAITGVKKVSITDGKGFSTYSAPSVTSRQESPEIPFYLFSLENYAEKTSGYVLACGDKRLPGIIAVVEDGNFEDEHPFREVFLANLTGYIMETIEVYNNITEADIAAALKNLEDKQDNSRSVELVIITVVGHPSPLVKTKWGQFAPYNKVLKIYGGREVDLPTGCIATAMAQIMAYHEWPSAPLPAVYHPTVGMIFDAFINPHNENEIIHFFGMSYEWDKMKENKSASLINLSYRNEIGVLMFQIGCAVDMIYGPGGSIASSENVPAAMALMGYLPGPLIDYDFIQIVQSISYGLPVCIFANSGGGRVGHAWVIDNYIAHLAVAEIQPGVFYQELFPFVHCNIGLDGKSDGWYYSGIFNAAGLVALDTDDQPLSFNYLYQQEIIPYILPIR